MLCCPLTNKNTENPLKMKIYEEINIKHLQNNDECSGDSDEDNDNGNMKKMIKNQGYRI